MEARASIPVSLPHPNPIPSYWHNPKSPLANHISSSELPKEADYVIIGSGISGTMIAHNLLAVFPSSSIIMLEAREACGGATGRNGGHTKAASYRSYMAHREELGKEEALKIARLEYENILAAHRFAKDEGIDCESCLCNTVDVVFDQGTFERGKQAIEMMRVDVGEEEEVARYQVWGKEEAEKRFWVSAENENTAVEANERLFGAFEYLAGRVSSYRFATGALEKCVQKGLKLWTNTPVNKVQKVDDLDSGDAMRWEVFTSRGSVKARTVVLATNGYTAHLMSSIQGIIVPMRGQITAQRPPRTAVFPTPLPTTYSFIYKTGYEYMIPRPTDSGQHIVIGGGLGRLEQAGASEYGTCDDSVLNAETSRYLKGSLVGYFGRQNWGEDGDGKDRIVQEWTGIMGATADGRPLVGEMPGMNGLWISAGFNGHGMVLCLKSAEALVKMMDGQKAEGFPQSFMISSKRMQECVFRGRTDMKV